jgi:hypothetical protein
MGSDERRRLTEEEYSWRSHRPPDVELGHGHALWYVGWNPDRELNPQYDGIPDIWPYSACVEHRRPDNGALCHSGIHFDSEAARALEEVTRRFCAERGIPYHGYPSWTVEWWTPLHVEPSLLCKATWNHPDGKECGDHGHIRGGVWVPC